MEEKDRTPRRTPTRARTAGVSTEESAEESAEEPFWDLGDDEKDRKIQELEGGVLVVPAAAPVEAPVDDGEPPEKLDGGALATVRSVDVIVKDTPEGSAPIAHVQLETSLPFVEGQCVSVLPPGNDEKGNPHKKRRLYTVASERGSQLALCVREVGVTSNFLHNIPKGSQLHLEGPVAKSMVLPADPKAGLVAHQPFDARNERARVRATGNGNFTYEITFVRLLAPGAPKFTLKPASDWE